MDRQGTDPGGVLRHEDCQPAVVAQAVPARPRHRDHRGPASGTSQLLALCGVGEDSNIVAGKYEESYLRNGPGWLIKSMRLRLHFSVPLTAGWAGVKRHYLVNSGEQVPDYPDLTPNRPL